MATLHRPVVSVSTSVTSTIIAPLSQPDINPTRSSTPEIKADPNVVTWESPDDPENPRNWSRKSRWFITTLISVTALCSYVSFYSLRSTVCIILDRTFSSSSPSAAAPFIAREFHSSKEHSYLVTSTYLLGIVPGPIFWGPGSEMFGRRAVLVPACIAYTLFNLGQSLAQNMATVLVTRFLCGFFASAPLNNCGGVLADLWDAASRVPASSLLFASVFLGPALGPTVGSL